jgi:acetyl esterase/lipase
VGGHSAGGHLAALLALDERYLKRHGLSNRNIRGTFALSGVYEIRGMEGVFGKDEQVRKEASPIHHVKSPAPPFVITYCQWDYLTLPVQARRFHRALREAGVSSELVYIPRQSHISEIVSIAREDDPTAGAILRVIRATFGG